MRLDKQIDRKLCAILLTLLLGNVSVGFANNDSTYESLLLQRLQLESDLIRFERDIRSAHVDRLRFFADLSRLDKGYQLAELQLRLGDNKVINWQSYNHTGGSPSYITESVSLLSETANVYLVLIDKRGNRIEWWESVVIERSSGAHYLVLTVEDVKRRRAVASVSQLFDEAASGHRGSDIVDALWLGVSEEAHNAGNSSEALAILFAAYHDRPAMQQQPQLRWFEARLATELGLEQYAASVLSKTLYRSRGFSIIDQSRAWLSLASLNVDAQRFGMAFRRLSKIPAISISEFLTEQERHAWSGIDRQRNIMVADIAIRQKNLQEAEKRLELLAYQQDIEWAFTVFNLASLYARESKYEDAVRHYRVLSSLPFGHELFANKLFLALFDKVWLNLGYAFLSEKRLDEALQAFNQVRLKGPYAIDGAMSLGWVENRKENYHDVLQPWFWLLGQRSYPYEPAALLGVADVYEQLGEVNLAVTAYSEADKRYLAMLKQVAIVLSDINANPLKDWLVLTKNDGSQTAYCDVNAKHYLPWLMDLLANTQFQLECQEWFSFLELSASISRWQRQIESWQQQFETEPNLLVFEPRLQSLVMGLASLKSHAEQHEADQSQIVLDISRQHLATIENKISHYQLAARLANARLLDVHGRIPQ